jgi:hypothetical protein
VAIIHFSPITSHRFRPPLTTKPGLLAVATATLRAACRFDRAQGPELAEGRLAMSLRSIPRAKTALPSPQRGNECEIVSITGFRDKRYVFKLVSDMPRDPRDHFVPKAYLRGFVPEYLSGRRGGNLVVYRPSSGNSKLLSINDYVACETEFYNNHPIDKHWSQTIEQSWPRVRQHLANRGSDKDLLDELFWFVSAQFIRTHSFMDSVARRLSWENRQVKKIPFEGRLGNSVVVGMAKTDDVMEEVQRFWPQLRKTLEESYSWTVCHNNHARLFLTSDDPCMREPSTGDFMMPVALDMYLIGKTAPLSSAPATLHHTNASPDIIKKANQTAVRGCNSFVYSHEETEELRRFVKKHYVEQDVALGGRGFSNEPEPMTDAEIQRFFVQLEALRRNDSHE